MFLQFDGGMCIYFLESCASMRCRYRSVIGVMGTQKRFAMASIPAVRRRRTSRAGIGSLTRRKSYCGRTASSRT